MEPPAHSRCSGNESDKGVTGAPAPFGSSLDRPSGPWPQHPEPCVLPARAGIWGQEPEVGADESYPAAVRGLSGHPRLQE